MRGQIHAVVLTYNRRDLLLQNLTALSQQTRPLDKILILDNGSTDGTPEAVGALALPNVVYKRLEQNIGVARGFIAAVQSAFEDPAADWIWLMDDDMVPNESALKELVSAFDRNFSSPDQIGFLMSQAVDGTGRAVNVPTIDPRPPSVHEAPGWGRLLDQGIVGIMQASLVALLIPRSTYETFGNLNPEFVVWGEDADFTSRICEKRPGLLVGTSKVTHLRAKPGELSIFTEDDPRRVQQFYYLYRNMLYLRRRFVGPHAYVSGIVRFSTDVSRLAWRGQWKKASIAARGILAGLTFNPRPPAPPPPAAPAPPSLF
ncbi:MAG: glycosyltransferase [Polyangiales bacterium]